MSNGTRPIDLPGALALIGFSALLGFNQVVIRVVNEGLQPVFFAGIRSAGALLCLYLWLWARGKPMGMKRLHLLPGIALGAVFAAEFVLQIRSSAEMVGMDMCFENPVNRQTVLLNVIDDLVSRPEICPSRRIVEIKN